jgi:drug/metabolite transporter (DMT)-like permease
MILIVLLYALWASSVTASKILIQYSQPIFLTGIRMFVAGALLLGYQYFFARHAFEFKRSHLTSYAQIIFFGIYATYILRFWAFESVSATKAMFLFNLSPFFSTLYSYFFLNEKLSRTQWAGLSLGFIGLIPVLLTTSKGELALGEFYFLSWQECAIIVSVAMHSYSWIVMKKLVRDRSNSPMVINGICMSMGGLMALVTSVCVEGWAPVTNVAYFFSVLAFVIIISNIICHNLYCYLLREYSATLVSFGGFLGPPFAAFYGWILFGESITWHFYVTFCIVGFGLYLFYKDEFNKNSFMLE